MRLTLPWDLGARGAVLISFDPKIPAKAQAGLLMITHPAYA